MRHFTWSCYKKTLRYSMNDQKQSSLSHDKKQIHITINCVSLRVSEHITYFSTCRTRTNHLSQRDSRWRFFTSCKVLLHLTRLTQRLPFWFAAENAFMLDTHGWQQAAHLSRCKLLLFTLFCAVYSGTYLYALYRSPFILLYLTVPASRISPTSLALHQEKESVPPLSSTVSFLCHVLQRHTVL